VRFRSPRRRTRRDRDRPAAHVQPELSGGPRYPGPLQRDAPGGPAAVCISGFGVSVLRTRPDGHLESEFLTDDNQIAEKKKKLDPDPLNREKFVRAVKDVETRANAALKIDPNDSQALFAMCIAQGVATDYMAFVEKKQFSSLSVAKRSNGYAQRLLKVEPKFYDAYLTAGISEYMIGSLPFSSNGLCTSITWRGARSAVWTVCGWWLARGTTSSRSRRSC